MQVTAKDSSVGSGALWGLYIILLGHGGDCGVCVVGEILM